MSEDTDLASGSAGVQPFHDLGKGQLWHLLSEQVELRLASAYTEAKANALNDVLEEFFFDDGTLWEAAPLPAGVRDVTYEILATMVRRPCIVSHC